MKPVSIILATTPKGEIGVNNTIPWKLKGDLPRFKQMTMGNIVIMGRKTYESLPQPLTGRKVIVISRRPGAFLLPHLDNDDLYSAKSLEEAFSIADTLPGNQIFIAGGVSLYEMALAADYPCTVELTTVYKESPYGYDAVIGDFSLKGFEYILDGAQVVCETDPKTGLVVVTHTYSRYVRS